MNPWAADPKLKEVGMYGQLSVENDIEGMCFFLLGVARQRGFRGKSRAID